MGSPHASCAESKRGILARCAVCPWTVGLGGMGGMATIICTCKPKMMRVSTPTQSQRKSSRSCRKRHKPAIDPVGRFLAHKTSWRTGHSPVPGYMSH